MKLETYLDYSTLEDVLFLARLYLGKVDMPYTKQKLIERLLGFLTEERRSSLVFSADSQESAIISLVHLFGPLSLEKLAYLSGLSEVRTRLLLSRMAMRFLIFENDDERWEENESFDLAPLYSDSILRSEEASEEESVDINLSDTLAGMASLLSSENLSKSRKENLRYLRAIGIADHFPRLGRERAERLAIAFIRTGLYCGFLSDESGFIKSTEKIKELASFTDRQLAFLLFVEGRYSESAYRAFLAQEIYGTREVNSKLRIIYPEIDRSLFYLSLVKGSSEQTEPTFVLSSDYTLTSSRKEESFILSRFMTIDKVDTYTTWTLTREAMQSGLDSGLTADSIIEYLSAFTAVPDAISERLRSWNESYERVRVYDYLYVETDERNARLIDSLPLLQIHIVKKVSKTGYLMKRTTEEQWRRILMYTGLEMIGKTEKEDGVITLPVERRENDLLDSFSALTMEGLPAARYEKRKNLAANLLRIDISKKLRTKEEKDSFTRLLAIGCIIDSSQIVAGQPFYGGRKATGFEYQVKLHLMKQAVKEGFLVELSLEDESFIAKVDSVQKVNEKDIAFIVREDGERSELDISKIFLVKELNF